MTAPSALEFDWMWPHTAAGPAREWREQNLKERCRDRLQRLRSNMKLVRICHASLAPPALGQTCRRPPLTPFKAGNQASQTTRLLPTLVDWRAGGARCRLSRGCQQQSGCGPSWRRSRRGSGGRDGCRGLPCCSWSLRRRPSSRSATRFHCLRSPRGAVLGDRLQQPAGRVEVLCRGGAGWGAGHNKVVKELGRGGEGERDAVTAATAQLQ